LSVPRFFLCIARFTLLLADLPYFRLLELFFRAAMRRTLLLTVTYADSERAPRCARSATWAATSVPAGRQTGRKAGRREGEVMRW